MAEYKSKNVKKTNLSNGNLMIFEKQIQDKNLSPIYLFFGDELYFLENAVNKIKKSFGMLQSGINYCVLDESNIENIISEIETPAFGFNKKLIIIKNANLFKSSKKKKKLEEGCEQEENAGSSKISKKMADYIKENEDIVKENVVIVIIEEEITSNNLLKVLLDSSAFIYEFQKLSLEELIPILKNICSKYKVNIENSTIRSLIENSGTSMLVLINEIRKLIEYVGEGGNITLNEINLLSIPEIDNIIFNLTDALGEKNIKKALDTFYDLIYLKQPIQVIIVTLYRHLKKLYLIKLVEECNDLNLAEILELKPNQTFLISKYLRQAKVFSKEGLEIYLKEFWDLDKKSKNGSIDLKIGMETLLCSFELEFCK